MTRRVYLDHGATTPVAKEVVDAMLPVFTDVYGNASSVHAFGRDARKLVDEARDTIAKAIGATAQEIYFTAGGTEADNLAIFGVAEALADKKGKHIITTCIEHHAIGETFEYLEKKGFTTTILPVDEHGLVNPADVEKAIRPDTILVSIMHANNEIGTIQPIAEIGAICKTKGVYLHTDAVQSVGHIPVNVDELGVNLLSMAAHKFYGPKGIGALYVRKGTRIKNVTHGGAQERKLRPGTENVPGIVGMAKALEIAIRDMDKNNAHLEKIRDYLIEGILKIPHTRLNGHPTRRLPGNVNVSIEYIEGESLLLSLDMKGIAASSGSACTSGSLEPSHVLMAIGLSHQTAHGSLRLTIGHENTMEDMDYVLEVLPPIVERLRAMSPIFNKQ